MRLLLLCLTLASCQRPEQPPPPPPPPPPVVIDTLPPPPAPTCWEERTPFTSIVTVCDRYPPARWLKYLPPVALGIAIGVLLEGDGDGGDGRDARPHPGCRHKHKHHCG